MKKRSLMLMVFIVSTITLTAQRTITGKIVDEKDTPLIGATVVGKGTTAGTVADID
ncbi:MAG: hypothetical protein HC912_06690, partial [Saprospiraceae bacterium]|nr:hypothetical protein [Saprospiraceae bacterium]